MRHLVYNWGGISVTDREILASGVRKLFLTSYLRRDWPRQNLAAFTPQVVRPVRMLVLALRRLCGDCKSGPILRSLDLTLRPKRVCNLLKPGKTKGAAAVGVVYKLLGTSTNTICIDKGPTGDRAGTRVNVIPRDGLLCNDLAYQSGLTFLKQLCNLSQRSYHRQLQIYLRSIGLLTRRRAPIRQLDNKVRQQLDLTTTVVRQPQLIVLSRPAAKLSVRTHRRI